MNEKKALLQKGEKAAKISTFTLIALSALKGVVALISGSIALLADSIHSFADIFSSIAVWAGLKLVQKKPTQRFPYGYYKAETLSLLIVSLIIIFSGILIIIESINKLLEPSVILFPEFVLIIVAISGSVSYILGRYKKGVGNLINSQSLVSEGQHSMVDVYTSILVFIGVIFSHFGYFMVEIIVGLVIGAYVIKIGLWFGKDAALGLMDACLSPQKEKEMKEMAKSVNGVKGVHGIRLRKSGPVSFGEMRIELKEDLSIDKAHEISTEIERRIKRSFKDIESINIDMRPARKDKIKIAIPISEDRGLESMSYSHFGGAPLFAFIEVEKEQIKNFYIKANQASKLTKKRGMATAHFLVDEKVDIVLAESLGGGPFHTLRDSIVQVYHIPKPMVISKTIHLLNKKSLERMVSPIEKNEFEVTD